MVSSEKFQLLTLLNEGRLERLEPVVDDDGDIEYEQVNDVLTSESDPVIQLNVLSEMDILDRHYTTKTYICPSCKTEGMQYITACPHCESTHTEQSTYFQHEICEYMAPSDEFESDTNPSDYYCPNCESECDTSELLIDQRHHCNDCEEVYTTPNHRLSCRSCQHLCLPDESTERTLYEYTLSEHGEQWYDNQLTAREALAEELSSRGFEVEVDISLPEDSTNPQQVHMYAIDDLLNQQFVVDVHSRLSVDDVQTIGAVAERTRAQPTLLTTDATISEEASTLAAQTDVLVLWIDEEGSITQIKNEGQAAGDSTPIMKRLTSVFDR